MGLGVIVCAGDPNHRVPSEAWWAAITERQRARREAMIAVALADLSIEEFDVRLAETLAAFDAANPWPTEDTVPCPRCAPTKDAA